MMKSRRPRVFSISRQNASTLGVCRRSSPKISSRSPHSPKSASREYRDAESRGKSRRHDEMRARAKQLEAGLIADLHPPAGQRAPRGREDPPARCAWRSSARRTPGTSDRRSDGSACTSACRRSSAGVSGGRCCRAAREPRSSTGCRLRCRRNVLLFEASPGGNTFGVVEDRLLPKRADARFGARDLVLLDALRLAIARRGLRHAPPLRRDRGCRRAQPPGAGAAAPRPAHPSSTVRSAAIDSSSAIASRRRSTVSC